MPKSRPTKKRRELIMLYRNGKLSKAETMKKLGMSYDYHAFNALFHNCTMEDFKD